MPGHGAIEESVILLSIEADGSQQCVDCQVVVTEHETNGTVLPMQIGFLGDHRATLRSAFQSAGEFALREQTRDLDRRVRFGNLIHGSSHCDVRRRHPQRENEAKDTVPSQSFLGGASD